eukprot:6172128-Pleurochrysis_carterae.AAC.7
MGVWWFEVCKSKEVTMRYTSSTTKVPPEATARYFSDHPGAGGKWLLVHNRFNHDRGSGTAGTGRADGRTYAAALSQGCPRAAAAMRKRGIQSLGSGARALRKYA